MACSPAPPPCPPRGPEACSPAPPTVSPRGPEACSWGSPSRTGCWGEAHPTPAPGVLSGSLTLVKSGSRRKVSAVTPRPDGGLCFSAQCRALSVSSQTLLPQQPWGFVVVSPWPRGLGAGANLPTKEMRQDSEPPRQTSCQVVERLGLRGRPQFSAGVLLGAGGLEDLRGLIWGWR